MKVEGEKKKYAASRKFKEAQTCQAQLKQLQSETEHCDKSKADFESQKQALEEEARTRADELNTIETRIDELTRLIEREH